MAGQGAFPVMAATKPGQSASARGGGCDLGQRRERIGGQVERVEDPPRRFRPDAGDQLQHAEARHPVARIAGEAQDGQQVLHMGAVEELQAAELHERHVAAGQLRLDLGGMAGGAEEHRLVLQPDPRLPVLEDAVHDVAGLLGLGAGGDEARLVGRGAVGPEILGEALPGPGDDRVRRREDRLGGAVVAVQRDDIGAGR